MLAILADLNNDNYLKLQQLYQHLNKILSDENTKSLDNKSQANNIRKRISEELDDENYSAVELEIIYNVGRKLTFHYSNNNTINGNVVECPISYDEITLKENDLTSDSENVFCIASGYVYKKQKLKQWFEANPSAQRVDPMNRVAYSKYELKKIGIEQVSVIEEWIPQTPSYREIFNQSTTEMKTVSIFVGLGSLLSTTIATLHFHGHREEVNNVTLATTVFYCGMLFACWMVVRKNQALAGAALDNNEREAYIDNARKAGVVALTAMATPSVLSFYMMFFSAAAESFAKMGKGSSHENVFEIGGIVGAIYAITMLSVYMCAQRKISRLTFTDTEASSPAEIALQQRSSNAKYCLALPAGYAALGYIFGAIIGSFISTQAMNHGVMYGLASGILLGFISSIRHVMSQNAGQHPDETRNVEMRAINARLLP